MSRWIDADAMLEYLDLMYDKQDDWREPYNVGVLGAINYIKHKAPSIDIVRCKECNAYMTDGYADGCGFCAYHQSVVQADDFCSYGEREGE